ncbi:hypothetical protein N9112_00095 [bacterium]|nr:hypothetical protein [bacterium]
MEDDDDLNPNPKDGAPAPAAPAPKGGDDDVKAQVDAAVAEALRPIKDKLDGAYTARDDALAKVAELEEEGKQRQIEDLKRDGKEREAFELELAEARAGREALEKRNIELTRDMDVNNALSVFDFRNARAKDIAFRDIVDNLVKGEDGQWVHRTGVDIKTAVSNFAKDDANEFLLKPTESNGAPIDTDPTPTNPGGGEKSLYAMTQDEVLKLAAEGKLRK